jgi:hypothetical protein
MLLNCASTFAEPGAAAAIGANYHPAGLVAPPAPLSGSRCMKRRFRL